MCKESFMQATQGEILRGLGILLRCQPEEELGGCKRNQINRVHAPTGAGGVCVWRGASWGEGGSSSRWAVVCPEEGMMGEGGHGGKTES